MQRLKINVLFCKLWWVGQAAIAIGNYPRLGLVSRAWQSNCYIICGALMPYAP